MNGLSPEVNINFDDVEDCVIAEIKILPEFLDVFDDLKQDWVKGLVTLMKTFYDMYECPQCQKLVDLTKNSLDMINRIEKNPINVIRQIITNHKKSKFFKF